MDMNISARKRGAAVKAAVLVVTFLAAAAIPMKTAYTYSYGEVVTISCYKGNPADGNYVGDLTVPNPENAGQSCNSLYDDCEGECSGCFSDSDITEDVCYDKAGKKFLN